MPALETRTHLPTTAAVVAVENVIEALDTILWLAQDISGGEFECGTAHVERQLDTLTDAIGDVLDLAARAAGRPVKGATLAALRATLLERMAVNATAKLVEAAA